MQTALMAVAMACCPAMAGDADVANERPPMTLRELEKHWGLDCAQERARALALFAETRQQTLDPQNGGTLEASARALELCAAARRAITGTDNGICPDFASAAAAMRLSVGARPERRGALRREIGRYLACNE